MYLVFCQSCMMMRTSSKKTQTYFNKAKVAYTDSTMTFDDYKLHYIETGKPDAPTLFFVHGSPGSWDAYKEYLTDSLLLKKYRMIAVDRSGFGYSNFREAQNLDTQAKRLVSFLEVKNNQKPTILIGHSMGGPIIVKMATINPNIYSHLVVLSGAIDPDAEKPEKWRSIVMKRPLRYLIPGALRPSNDELWWLKEDLKFMKEDLKNITSSVTIIHGTKDPLVPYSNVTFMEKEFINAKSINVIAIKDANHFIPWEHFATIRDALMAISLDDENSNQSIP